MHTLCCRFNILIYTPLRNQGGIVNMDKSKCDKELEEDYNKKDCNIYSGNPLYAPYYYESGRWDSGDRQEA